MKFKEALAELKEKYPDDYALSYTSGRHSTGEYVSIYAHGNGVCGSSDSYRGAIDELGMIVSGAASKDEAPE